MFENKSDSHELTFLPTLVCKDVETLGYFSLRLGDYSANLSRLSLYLYNVLLLGNDLSFTLVHIWYVWWSFDNILYFVLVVKVQH